MNIVFLVHYFPPLNSTGARRILAFAKYLHRKGHLIHVISTPKTKRDGLLSETVPDFCNLVEVSWFKRKSATIADKVELQTEVVGRSKIGNILIKVKRKIMKYCGQLLDHRLIFSSYFLNPLLPRALKKILSDADVIISSCPPWPVHLAGLICSKRFKKKWVADYRDHFSGYHFFPGNKLTQRIEFLIDKWMLKKAEVVTVVSPPMQEYYQSLNRNVYCIENGFDEEQLACVKKTIEQDCENKKTVCIRYLGTITYDRIPEVFLLALSRIDKILIENLVIEFYGESGSTKEILNAKFPELAKHINFFATVSHQEALRLMLMADALLFKETSSTESLSTKGTLTVKLFEYLAAHKPIIAEINKATLMGDMIIKSGLGCAITTDEEEMYQSILAWLTRKQLIAPNLEYISQFSRKIKTDQFEKAILSKVYG